MTLDERAELHALRDVAKRLINFDGGAELMPWVSAHRLHREEPYMGCLFCRDRFIERVVTEEDIARVYAALYGNGPMDDDLRGLTENTLRAFVGGPPDG